jgi:hypothetical protein
MDYEIRPDPDEAEREAILAALAADETERELVSPWAQGVLPQRGRDRDEP